MPADMPEGFWLQKNGQLGNVFHQKQISERIRKYHTLGISDDSVQKNFEIMLLYMTTVTRLYAKYWKVPEILSVEEQWIKTLDLAKMDKLTIFLEVRSVKTSMDN